VGCGRLTDDNEGGTGQPFHVDGFFMSGSPIGSRPRNPSPTDASSAALPFRVLVEPPTATTIPIFALGVEAGRPATECAVISDHEAVKAKVSGNTGRALRSGRYGEHQLVNTRRRVGQRTALYSSWIAFDHLHQAEAFVRDYPRLGLVSMRAKTTAAIRERENRLRNGLASGRYDLGRIDQNARLLRAREYVQLSDELDKLEWTQFAFKKLDDSLVADTGWQSIG